MTGDCAVATGNFFSPMCNKKSVLHTHMHIYIHSHMHILSHTLMHAHTNTLMYTCMKQEQFLDQAL